QHVADADAVQHACEHQHQRHVLQTLGVAILGPDEVHVRLGQRAIVANAAGQHVLDAALLALVENPGLDDLLRDGFADAADAPHGRYLVGHEREPVTIAILKRRNDADAFTSADDGVALPDIAELRAGRARALDDDHRVHALIGDERPLAALANVRLVIGRRI